MKFLFFGLLLSTELVSAFRTNPSFDLDRRDDTLGAADNELFLEARDEPWASFDDEFFLNARDAEDEFDLYTRNPTKKPSGNAIPLKTPAGPSNAPAGNPGKTTAGPSNAAGKLPASGYAKPGTDLEAQTGPKKKPGLSQYLPKPKTAVQGLGAGLDAISSGLPSHSAGSLVGKGLCKLGAEACKIMASKMKKRALIVQSLVESTLMRRGLDLDTASSSVKYALAKRWDGHVDEMFVDELVW